LFDELPYEVVETADPLGRRCVVDAEIPKLLMLPIFCRSSRSGYTSKPNTVVITLVFRYEVDKIAQSKSFDVGSEQLTVV
jgi:hypothetical protein